MSVQFPDPEQDTDYALDDSAAEEIFYELLEKSRDSGCDAVGAAFSLYARLIPFMTNAGWTVKDLVGVVIDYAVPLGYLDSNNDDDC